MRPLREWMPILMIKRTTLKKPYASGNAYQQTIRALRESRMKPTTQPRSLLLDGLF